MKHYFVSIDEKVVYKFRKKSNDWLLITPNYNQEDRRKSDSEIEEMSGKYVTQNYVMEIVHKIWRDYDPVWEYNGKQYTTVPLSSIQRTKIPHHFEDENIYIGGFVFCMVAGQLRWAHINSQYYPQVEIFEVNNGEDRPITFDFEYGENGEYVNSIKHGGWTNISNIKLVKCITDDKIV